VTAVQIRPTDKAIQCADLLNEAITRALVRRDSVSVDELAYYEAHWEAHIQLLIAIRHLDSLVTLARTDLCLYPSAMVLARSALEIAAWVMWLMTPADPFERETRFLLRLADYAHNYRRLAKHTEDLGQENSAYRDRAATIQRLHDQLKAKLAERSYEPTLKQLPKVKDMISDIGLVGQLTWY
jgi:hypothetical protein